MSAQRAPIDKLVSKNERLGNAPFALVCLGRCLAFIKENLFFHGSVRSSPTVYSQYGNGLFLWGDNPVNVKMASAAEDLNILSGIIRSILVDMMNFRPSLYPAYLANVRQFQDFICDCSSNYPLIVIQSSFFHNRSWIETNKNVSVDCRIDRIKSLGFHYGGMSYAYNN